MAKATELADALSKLKPPNGAGKHPASKSRKGPTKEELRAAVKAMRSAKDDDEATEAWLRLNSMTGEYDPTED